MAAAITNLEVVAEAHATEAEIQRFMREFESFAGRNLRRILKGVKAGERQAAESAKMLGSLRREFEQAGLDGMFAKLNPVYARQLKSIAQQYEKLGFKKIYSDADQQLAQTLLSYDVSAIKTRVFAGLEELRSAVMRQVLAGQPDFEDLIDRSTDQTGRAVETELRTAVSGFNQSVTNLKAEQLGFELFVYLGPEDDVTRPFCECVIEGGRFQGQQIEGGRVYTREEIEGFDNGQGLPVFVYGGGYNCRHQWRPITAELAEAEFGYRSQASK